MALYNKYERALTSCKNEEERRAYFPQLCKFADMVEAMPHPFTMLKATAWILKQRQREREAAESGKQDK